MNFDFKKERKKENGYIRHAQSDWDWVMSVSFFFRYLLQKNRESISNQLILFWPLICCLDNRIVIELS